VSSSPTVLVLGAGIVGVSCALALQARGFAVTLADRRAPGEETSHGNAGVIARSSLVPFNHPRLWRALPTLLKNQSAGFCYAPAYLRRNWRWAAQFLLHARATTFDETTRALDALITLSMREHARLRDEAGVAHRFREDGWLYAYRSERTFDASQWQRDLWATFDVKVDTLDAHALPALEPALTHTFARAAWVRDAWCVDEPGAVVKAYAQLFTARGGTICVANVPTAQIRAQQWATSAGAFDHLVVALGPWSAAFLNTLNIKAPLAFERGYHQHFSWREGVAPLTRALYDVEGGYVAAPMAGGVRLSTGVELNALDAPAQHAQLARIAQSAREALPLADALLDESWRGARPTLPDSRPAIGASSAHSNLWLAFGHQHIGFSTGPGTGALLAALMTGTSPPIAAQPFAPGRFRL
jgi:D-amino-acid dehydrogenase